MRRANGDIAIRRLEPADAAALAELFERNATPMVVAHFHPFPLTRATARKLATKRTKDLYYVASFGQELAGFMMLRGWDEGFEVPSFGFLVDRAAQGRGLGKRLAATALDEARAGGAERVRATVYASNRSSVAALQGSGFVEVSREPVERPYGHDERILMTADVTK
jgi:ribosomal-protein-alanine N-acetyltransferase